MQTAESDLEQVDKTDYELYEINNACGLSEFFNKKGMEFYRSCTFYEFQNETEDVPQNSRIILIDKVG